jgi:hypothetical protein
MRFAALLTLLLIAAAAQAQQGPLAFHATAHDFGEVTDEVVVTTFTFVNAGQEPLRLVQVQPSCGCTVPRYTDMEVAPGETGEVVVSYDPAARIGPFSQSVRVVAEAGGSELSETLRISGSAVPGWTQAGPTQGDVRFDAETVDVGAVVQGLDVRASFRLLRTGNEPLRLISAAATPAPAEVRYPRRTLYPNDVMQIDVTVPAGSLQAGPFEVLIRLETDDAAEPVKILRLAGRAE